MALAWCSKPRLCEPVCESESQEALFFTFLLRLVQELAEKHGWYLARQFENEARSGVVCLAHLTFAGLRQGCLEIARRVSLRFVLGSHQANPAYHACASDGERWDEV